MLLWTTLKIALASLAVNKLRSILTMLGVIIGVGAVIAMLSLGTAFTDQISGQIRSMGTNLLFIGPSQHGPGARTMTQNLTPDDAEALLAVAGVKAVTPMSFNGGQIKAGNRNTSSASISGVAPSLLTIQNYQIARGRMFTDSEVRGQLRVAVIGPKTAKDLFAEEDPVGRHIKIHGVTFLVIGLVESKGGMGDHNPDDQVWLPYTTAMRQIPPRRTFVNAIAVETTSKESLQSASEGIKQVLRQRHRLGADEKDDFNIQNMAELLATFQRVMMTLTLFLGTVAAISLIVGGIGIMNIMLATVAERTREIGVRKALGAKDRAIMGQFLIEALVITLGGGLLGLMLGWGVMALVAFLIRNTMPLSPMLQWWVVAMSIGVATTVGLISGLYPAFRASRLDPISALRYE